MLHLLQERWHRLFRRHTPEPATYVDAVDNGRDLKIAIVRYRNDYYLHPHQLDQYGDDGDLRWVWLPGDPLYASDAREWSKLFEKAYRRVQELQANEPETPAPEWLRKALDEAEE